MALQRPLNVIIPTLNEASSIGQTLGTLRPARQAGCRVIVVDGGSTDETQKAARPLADQVLQVKPGRARQMQAGIDATDDGDFWLLHADTQIEAHYWQGVVKALQDSPDAWGRFDVSIAGQLSGLPMVASLMNRRSRWSGIATGDQAIFVRREALQRAGGIPQQELMEDIELSRRLKAQAAPVCLDDKVVTSGRRWVQHGLWRTIALMWFLRGAYALGASPRWLAQRYRAVR